nr:probable pyridoxal 5'-phosphate synthase subunit PDX2 [Nicotiana tomentosiformis]
MYCSPFISYPIVIIFYFPQLLDYQLSMISLMLQDSTESQKKVIVAVKQGNLLATAFHPELTADTRWHSYFLKMLPEIGEGTSAIISTSTTDQSFTERSIIDFPIYQ